MRNNFTFCSSIKKKYLEKMEDVIDLLYSEKLDNEDLEICVNFRNMLDSFDEDIKKISSADVIDKFFNFYEEILVPYCKKEQLGYKTFEFFDFEQTQFVFDKMTEIIEILVQKYNV
jgi:hypothetical protein